MRRGQIIPALALITATLPVDGQQARDAVRRQAAGDASIHGIALAKGSDPQPLRRARITVNGLDVDYTATVITADDGTFELDGLPAGSYTLRGAKEPFIATAAGARRPGGSGEPVTLNAGARRRIDLQLPRGGVITGRVHGPDGEPAPGLTVAVLTTKYLPAEGERRLAQTGVMGLTDDRGEYRIYGLPPGDYVVQVRPAPGASAGLQVLTEAEVRAALAQTSRSLWSGVRPGSTNQPPPPASTSAPPRATVGLATIYHPGTPFLDRAALVRLGEGDARSAVDVDLDHVPLATVEGAVTIPTGAARVQVSMTRAAEASTAEMARYASPDADGGFTFRAVPPGRYRLLARVLPARGGPGVPGTTHAGTAEIIVSGDDIAGLSIPLQPALSISGRLVFDPPLEAPLAIRGLPSIPLAAINVAGSAVLPAISVDGDQFTVGGIIPGKYRFSSGPPGIRSPVGRWWLKSALVGGREILDEPLDIQASATDAVLRWSEWASELSGRVRAGDGAPGRAAWVVVFSRDPRSWFFNSRRVAAVRTAADGGYTIRNLPAGDYLAIATRELEHNEWFDPEALRELAPGAVPVRITGDDSTTAPLVIAR